MGLWRDVPGLGTGVVTAQVDSNGPRDENVCSVIDVSFFKGWTRRCYVERISTGIRAMTVDMY